MTKTVWLLFVVQELSGQRMNWQNPASSETSVWRLEIMLAPSPFPHTMAGLISRTCSLCGCLADRRSHDGTRTDVPEHLDTGAVVRGANPSLRLGIQNETTQFPLGLGAPSLGPVFAQGEAEVRRHLTCWHLRCAICPSCREPVMWFSPSLPGDSLVLLTESQ